MNFKQEDIKSKFKYIASFLFIGILVLILLITVYQFLARKQNIQYVKNSYSITKGWIIKYHSTLSVESGNITEITYSYKVGANIYSRYITQSNSFEECEGSNSINPACSKKTFWVIYSKRDPSRSLVNLKIDIQNPDNKKFPKTLDDFY